MLDFFKRFSPSARKQDEAVFRSICSTLSKALKKRTLLTITVAGKPTPKQYTSILLDLFENNRRLIFDRLLPEESEHIIKVGSVFKISGIVSGISFKFKCKVIGIEKDKNNNTVYRANFPSTIYTEQQRGAFRVSVSSIRKIKVIILSTKQPPTKAFLRDISASGLRFIIPKSSKSQFKENTLLNCCILFLPDSPKLFLRVEIKHVDFNDELQFVQIGCKFVALPRNYQRLINRFINSIQREERRKDQGEDLESPSGSS